MAINDNLYRFMAGAGTINDKMNSWSVNSQFSDLSTFWGVNGHLTWTWTPNAQAQLQANWANTMLRLRELGVKYYRNGYSWQFDASHNITGSDGNTFINFIDNWASPAGVQVTPVLLAPWDQGTDEATNYTVAFNCGVEAATKLKGRVPWYECGNENETYAINGGARGNADNHYDTTKFKFMRGLLRGLIDGVKSVDKVTPIVIGGGTWLHTSFFDMLLKGRDPSGATGAPVLDWDITAWHWYTHNWPPNDDIENPTDQGGYNVLAALASWGKPIHMNEIGSTASNYSSDETQITNAILGNYCANRFWNVRQKYNIQHCSFYQLFDSASAGIPATGDEMKYGLIDSVGTTKKGRFTDIKNYISIHRG